MAKAPDYDTQSLRDSIKFSRRRIKTFQDAIANEEKVIADYVKMIEHLEKKKEIAEGVVIDANADH